MQGGVGQGPYSCGNSQKKKQSRFQGRKGDAKERFFVELIGSGLSPPGSTHRGFERNYSDAGKTAINFCFLS